LSDALDVARSKRAGEEAVVADAVSASLLFLAASLCLMVSVSLT